MDAGSRLELSQLLLLPLFKFGQFLALFGLEFGELSLAGFGRP